MTIENIFDNFQNGKININEINEFLKSKDIMKKIRYYINRDKFSNDALSDIELSELEIIVKLLNESFTISGDDIITDSEYDILQELLVNMGIPRLTGSYEINDAVKQSHKYTTLRGSLSKIYYLNDDTKRTNKSRKRLSEWIKSTELKYEKDVGAPIDLRGVDVIIQPKFDGVSCILDISDSMLWLTRGDVKNNKASDVSHVMNIFNSEYRSDVNMGIKFEVMLSEDDLGKVNQLTPERQYKNTRQVVTSILNSKESDFKSDYLVPIPLRYMTHDDDVESIHSYVSTKMPSTICKLGDIDTISRFANKNKYVKYLGKQFRTDGIVITIIDKNICKILGRTNDINNFEVAYKFTEETAYTKVRDIEFYVSEFGYITPVLVTNDVVLKGNTVNHISISNKTRFDELNLGRGDIVKVLYDIIPYVTQDDQCTTGGRKIPFTNNCPTCGSDLDTSVVQVRCANKHCPSKLIGKIQNYCNTLNIHNIGYSTLELLYDYGLLDEGIVSLYNLHKRVMIIETIEGFGQLRIKKILKEIDAKRKLYDYQFFGAIGIDNISEKTFEKIFNKIEHKVFLKYISTNMYDGLFDKLVSIQGIGESKAESIINYFKNGDGNELKLLKKDINITSSHNIDISPIVIFSGMRPNNKMIEILSELGYNWSSSYTNSGAYLVIPTASYTSSKVAKANAKGMPIIAFDDKDPIKVLQNMIVSRR